MAESSGEVGAPSLNLTPDEKRVYGQLFRQADTESVGVVTGDVAVKFFEKTKLESTILGEIWQIADRENRGFLTPAGFGVVLRLIGHCQAGREPTAELALQPGPLPRFDGIIIPNLIPQTTGPSAGTPSPLQAQGTGGSSGGPIRIPPLTPEKAAQFAGLFERQNLTPGNMLPGDQVKSIFEKSGLPTEILGRIWQLADTEQRGALVLTEFVIAMHLLTSMKAGQLRALPNILPAALYEAASRRPTGIPRQQQSPTSAGPQMSAIPRQLSGQAQMRTGSPLGRAQAHPPPPPPPQQQQQQGDWLVTPTDKAHFDKFYSDLDTDNKGFITGVEAVTFFSQSKLPEDTLAQIWDLADTTSSGRLSRDEFAIAMYLIRQQRSKRDGPTPLPATLPPNLMPPSMRNKLRPSTATAPPAAAAAAIVSPFDLPIQQPAQPPPPAQPAQSKSSDFDDFFGPAATVQQPMNTGGSNDPFGSNASPVPASPAKASSPIAPSFTPFVPSSSFGRTLTVHATGNSTGSASAFPKSQSEQASPPVPSASPSILDLLSGVSGGLDDTSKNLNSVAAASTTKSDTAELASLSNQISSLSKQMQDVQGQRTTTQNEINQASIQKKTFEQRLSQLRTLYEKEAKDVKALEEQLNSMRNDNKRIQVETAMVEGSYEDLQNQHRQLSAALQADQQENMNLRERIKAVNGEVAQLKQQIEKLKLDARQQRGLVAINKKQLSTAEAERDKLKSESEELAKSNEELVRQVNTSSPVSVSAQVASPALSTASGNNPFFRRTGSTDIMGAFASPPPPAKPLSSDKSFDDVFGPSLFPSTSTPPATSFLPQHTGASTGSGSAASFATPATSNTPTVSRQATMTAEPPAPPESRQMSSSYLPFSEFAESISSSRQVSPPLSRMGQADNSSVGETQATAVAPPPLEPTATGQSSASGLQSQQPSDAQASSLAGAIFDGMSSPPDSNSTPAPAPTVSQARGHSDSVNDPFSSLDQAKAKEDFESAFASFKSSRTKSPDSIGSKEAAAKPFAAFDSEFPPISELERDDDDSESASDNGGFDDDFAPVSPRGVSKTAPPSVPSTEKDQAPATAPAPAPSGAESATRDLAASPTAATSSSSVSTAMPTQPSTVDSIFGSSIPAAAPTSPGTAKSETGTAPPSQSLAKKPFEDSDDDDFEGLEDAREGSTADDDFANISRSALDDFNPVFDSSPPRSHATKSDSSNQAGAGGAPHFGAENSSFDFVSGSSASLGSGSGVAVGAGVATASNVSANGSATGLATTGGAAPITAKGVMGTGSRSGSGSGAGAADNPDWEALFASLDEPSPSQPPNATPIAHAAGAAAPASMSPAGSPPAPAPARPAAAGRALTEEGEHDDPILKNLTGMGYSRNDAVSALEKYDYNLERAANYLASQS